MWAMTLVLCAGLLAVDVPAAAAQGVAAPRLQAQTDDYRRTVSEGALLGVAAGAAIGGIIGATRAGGGAATGAYDARIAARTQQLAAIGAADAKLRASLASSEAEAARLDRQVSAATRAAEARQRDLAGIDAQIRRLEASNTVSRAELAQIERERDAAAAQLAGLMAQARQQEAASRALQGGAVASATTPTPGGPDFAALDQRLSALRRAVSTAAP
ncbi:hypothetical protein J5J86_20590 [Aquabacter sp. L1I39]|uniref:hypothetical protein n=1 Tax=Aquabacter sp. L1I39 TaxID=2820278 RepID=UPI001ADA37EF|nr:hypothetical protein [Aquabacter sp. L1I39]QTL03127.1 hypothetical protein J5J86_20590 [Aquabacter sp. L1I39]